MKNYRAVAKATEFNFEDAVNAIGKDLDMDPVSLDRKSFVDGSISLDSLTLDLIMGGGIAPRRWTTFFGFEGSGKSTAAFHGMRSAVNMKIPCLFFDYEGADPLYLSRIGLDIKNPLLKIFHPTTGEQTYRFIKRFASLLPEQHSGQVQAAFFIDSFTAMLPEAIDENDEFGQRAVAASMHSSKIPLIRSMLNRKSCALVGTNQLRLSPQAMFGSPEYEPGGEALKFYSDVRLRMQMISPRTVGATPMTEAGKTKLEEEPCVVGKGVDRYTYSTARTVKNKAFSPFRTSFLRFWTEHRGMPGHGIDPVYDTYQFLVETGQAVYKRGRMNISIQGFNDKSFTWLEFKKLIIDDEDEVLNNEGLTLREVCRSQIADSTAFEMFFNVSGGLGLVSNEKETGRDDEDGSFAPEE